MRIYVSQTPTSNRTLTVFKYIGVELCCLFMPMQHQPVSTSTVVGADEEDRYSTEG